MSIRKTNIGSSASIQIPLKNPKDKFGKTFRINKIFVDNGVNQPELVIIKDETGEKLFSQETLSSKINLRWSVTEPKDNKVIKNESLVKKNQYIDSFDVFVYRQDPSTLNNPSFEGGKLIHSETGISGNQATIDASGDFNRYLNVSVVLNDKFGNKETGYLYMYNPPPTGEITSYNKAGGNFEIEYTGTSDLQGINMYLFTGTNAYGQLEDTVEFKSGAKIKTVNYNRSGSIPLLPDRNNYLMAVPFDNLGEGGPLPLVGQAQDPYKASGVNFKPIVKDVSETKVEGGIRSLIKLNYDWQDHQIVDLIYKVDGTGLISKPKSGYNGNILIDHASINNSISTEVNDNSSFYYDHTYDFLSKTTTGDLQEKDGLIYGSGAGDYFKGGEVLYSGESGIYEYAYYDVDEKRICFHTYEDILSGQCYVNGTFSMERDNPNALSIQFREGEKFSSGYEMSASYLNQIAEMPAVILNKSQWNQVNQFSGAKGWLGLRRGNVGVFDEVFDSEIKNRSSFNQFHPSGFSSGDYINNNNEVINFTSNDVGSGWCWVNSSGSHVYRDLGCDYLRNDSILIRSDFIKRENQERVGGHSKVHVFNKIELDNLNYTTNGTNFSITYEIRDSEFKKNKNNLDLTKISFHTGDMPNIIPDDNNFYSEATIEDSTVDGLHVGAASTDLEGNRPQYITIMTHDDAGPNKYYQVNDDIEYLVPRQETKFDLEGVGTSFNVPFRDKHTSIPSVSFNINYTGSSTPTFINAMMIGEPTISGVDFLINQSVPSAGYVLNITSQSEEAED
jgi:hypothetical protein